MAVQATETTSIVNNLATSVCSLACWGLVVMAATACGSVVNAGAGGSDGAIQDDSGGDLSVNLDGSKDSVVAEATVGVDAEKGPDPGSASVDAGAKCPGAPGCTCKENGDCDNAQCIEIGSGKVCATPCVDKCQDGYKCTLINSGSGDSVTICVPKYVHLCDPCTKSKDCQTLGSGDAACVNEGGQGNFCGTACAVDGDCAAGYGCQSVNSVEGAPVKQCVKMSSAPELKYGECTCSELAVAQKSQSSCFIEHKNDKGELVGKCAGVRACGASGLTTCAAPALDVEVCDGKDNDCDGLTDESTCDAGGACNVGTCDPQSGCQYNKLNNVPCDADKNACTDNDQCKQGVCVPGPGKVCDDGNPCTTDSCDPASGCTKTVDDGKLCDADGDACTAADHCVGATCSPGKAVVCDNTNPCSKASCNSLSGKCVGKSVQDGVPCDDGTVCTQGDHCQTGECFGKIVSCDDNNPCTGNNCDKVTGCATTNLDGIACDDDNPCTIGDLCKVGLCAKGAAKACESGAACVAGTCDLTNGKCAYQNKVPGAPCDDGDACSENDGCTGGVCQGKSLNCDDSNACTNDSCDSKLGCVHKANTSPCSDGDACTQSDVCADSKCVSGAIKVCEDNVLCTADTCNKTTGVCIFDATAMNGTPCDDGNGCTLGDNCKGGFCSVGIQKDCNDNNTCTDDLCDKVKGCNPSFNSKACDDSNACTKDDICKFGDCEGGVVSCNDGNPCTDDACDPKKGCVNNANSVSCNDNNACTEKDQCKNGACGGAPVNCDDGNVCSDDSCDKTSGCANAPNLALCPDIDACTTGEVCKNMNCVKKVVACDDLNACTLDTCDSVKGCQVANVVDKTPCGGNNWCVVGKCVPNDSLPSGTKLTFTPCKQKGPTGPSQGMCDTEYAGTPQAGKVTLSGGIQLWTAPAAGTYKIEVFGAQGGPTNGGASPGGKGARAYGEILLAQGQQIKILVGQMGLFQDCSNQGVFCGSGGGGGSFVTKTDNTPLVIAGGGGGAELYQASPFQDATGSNTGASTNGQPGAANGAGGALSNGGGNYGAAGGGLLTNGANATVNGGTTFGGTAYIAGGQGGLGGTPWNGQYPTTGHGGFGGGGAMGSDNVVRAGGGGGYSGGMAGYWSQHPAGGGGGSYASGANAVMQGGIQVGEGKVVITSP